VSAFGLPEITSAAQRIGRRVNRTPMLTSRTLGDRAGVTLLLKCESFQKTGSFKARGALNKVLSLAPSEVAKGLITVSAGNHAQAVAWAAAQVGAPCTVVMPVDAPKPKLEAVSGYGAEIILHDDRDTLFDKLHAVQRERQAVFVHPFDDPVVLAGAGTVGLEIMEDVPEADIVVVPVGGGGLMSGVMTAVKSIRPATRVVPVELAEGPGLAPALAAGRPVPVTRPRTLADGMTPPFVGAIPLEIARRLGDPVVGVTESEILQAMALLMTRAKLYVEASAAAATAALLAGKIDTRGRPTVVALVSGGNLDPKALPGVFEREPAMGAVR
jgi:threonine dehydratase